MKNIKYSRICKVYKFSASHQLPHVPDGHKCKRLHGHNYKIEIEVRGEINFNLGWVVDFAEIDDNMKPIIEKLDHFHLNDIPGLENPTAENIAHWILNEYPIKYVFRVRVWETDKCWADAINADGLWTKDLRL